MLNLKLQYFGHLMWRDQSLEKTLMLGKIEDRRKRGQQRTIWVADITDSMDMFEQTPGDSEGLRKPGVLQPMGSQRVGHDWATELLDYWSTTLLISEPTKGSDSGEKVRPLSWVLSLFLLLGAYQNGEIETATQFSNWPLLHSMIVSQSSAYVNLSFWNLISSSSLK